MNPASMSPSQDELLYEYLLEMGALQPQQHDISRQRAMIEQLRGASQVPTEARQAGRVVTARSPLEMLAPVIGQGIASYKERGANKAADVLSGKRLEAIGRLRGRLGGGGTNVAFPTRPYPGEETPLG